MNNVLTYSSPFVQNVVKFQHIPVSLQLTWALCLITTHLCVLYVQLISTFCSTRGFLLSLPRGRLVTSLLKCGTTYPSISGFALPYQPSNVISKRTYLSSILHFTPPSSSPSDCLRLRFSMFADTARVTNVCIIIKTNRRQLLQHNLRYLITTNCHPRCLLSLLLITLVSKLFVRRRAESWPIRRWTWVQVQRPSVERTEPTWDASVPPEVCYAAEHSYTQTPNTNGAEHRYMNTQKLVSEKLVMVSVAYDMQSCIDFFWYQILLSDRTCSIRYQKLVPVSGTGFLSVCHWH